MNGLMDADAALTAEGVSKGERRTKEFPATVMFAKKGEKIVGHYTGTDSIPPGDGRERAITTHVFKLRGMTPGLRLARKEDDVEATQDLEVAVASAVLDGALKEADKGRLVAVMYQGTQKKGKGGKNPAKLFEVTVY